MFKKQLGFIKTPFACEPKWSATKYKALVNIYIGKSLAMLEVFQVYKNNGMANHGNDDAMDKNHQLGRFDYCKSRDMYRMKMK